MCHRRLKVMRSSSTLANPIRAGLRRHTASSTASAIFSGTHSVYSVSSSTPRRSAIATAVCVCVAFTMTCAGGISHLSAIRALAASATLSGIAMRSQVTMAIHVVPLSMTTALAKSSSSTFSAYLGRKPPGILVPSGGVIFALALPALRVVCIVQSP